MESCAFWSIKLGTLSKDDDDDSENDGKKNKFAFFQTYSRLFGSAHMLNAGDFSWS